MDYKYCKRSDDDEQGGGEGWHQPRSKARSWAAKPPSRLNSAPQSLVQQKLETVSEGGGRILLRQAPQGSQQIFHAGCIGGLYARWLLFHHRGPPIPQTFSLYSRLVPAFSPPAMPWRDSGARQRFLPSIAEWRRLPDNSFPAGCIARLSRDRDAADQESRCKGASSQTGLRAGFRHLAFDSHGKT